MLNIHFDPFPNLETDRLILRKPDLKDVDELFIYRSNKEYMRYIPHRFVTEKEQVVQVIQFIHNTIKENKGINWAVDLKNTGALTGMVGYVQFHNDRYRAEIGYMFFTPYHGTGVAKEATQAVIDYGFNKLNLHSIEAVVNHENIPSQKLLEKLNFTKDAFFKDYLHCNGAFIDATIYSLINRE